jgi:hypothetical protein
MAASSTPTDEPAELDPTLAPLDAVSETGIPGLDSDDLFCAAWSRFAGTWQVLSVGSSFLGDPDRVAIWEVASSSVVAQAYADLIDNFPEPLAAEADRVADGYFGVLYRRSSAAGAALLMAGADAAALTRLSDAWLAALAERDPSDPDVSFAVPAQLEEIVNQAAVTLRTQRVEFHLDPSMVVGVETPLTDAFLETACPDQGTLTGQEIDGT